jgi:hypothetical protein
MKYISKLLSALLILALLAIPASAGVQNREVNLIFDGDMEKATIEFASGNSATLSKQEGSPNGTGASVLRVAHGGTNTPFATKTGILTSGVFYRITGQLKGSGSHFAGVSIFPAVYAFQGTSLTEWQHFDVVAQASGTALNLICVGATSGSCEFDNISITRYYGTVQNREVNLTSDGNMEKSGTTGYARINSSTLTKAANTWNLEGKQVLKVENNNVNKAFGLSPPASVLTGERWRVRGRVKSSDASLRPIAYRIGGASQALWIGANSTDVQYMDAVTTMNADGTITFYCTEPSLTANYCEWDDISITRYYGAVQNRDTALGTDLNFEKAGTSDFGVVFANLTKETNDRGDDGKQFLRVEYDGGVGNAYAAQAILTIGVPHKITGYWRTGDANYVCRLVAYGAGGITFGTTNSTSWIPFSYTFTPNFAILGLGSTQIGRIGSYCDYDNISVTRVY